MHLFYHPIQPKPIDVIHKFLSWDDAKGLFLNIEEGTTMTEQEILAANRFTRTRLLLVSDYTQNSDTPLDDSKKAEWATYRQALRDLPSSLGSFNSAILADSDLPTQPS